MNIKNKKIEKRNHDINKLPLEILNKIFGYLDKKSLYNVLITNKNLSKVAIACLWNTIYLTNNSFLPYLLTFIDYYSIYYKIIIESKANEKVFHFVINNENQWYNNKLLQFYKEYKAFLSKKDKKELNVLKEFYLKNENLCIPYYPYLSYIKNIYIEDENEDEEESYKNERFMKAINAISTYLKYCHSFPSFISGPVENSVYGKVKMFLTKLFNRSDTENNEISNNYDYENIDINKIILPPMNIQKLIMENVYITYNNGIQLSESVFKYVNNIKHIDFFYCQLPYKDLLYLPVYCSNIKTILLEQVNYDEYILLCYIYQLKSLKHFGFSLNKPLSSYTLYLLTYEYNMNCFSTLKSLRLNSDEDLLQFHYNNEELVSSSNLQESYINYLKERSMTNQTLSSNENENNNNENNNNENNNNENNNNENNNNENDNNENNNNENNNNENNTVENNNDNHNNNSVVNNENDMNTEDKLVQYINPDENLSFILEKYYSQFKTIINVIEKRNSYTIDYHKIKSFSVDLDKFLNLINNPGYYTWKIIAKSCHNLTHLTLSFSVRLIILKSFFINNPNLEAVVIQDIKVKSHSSTNNISNTKWDKQIQEKEEKNNFSSFPILSNLKSLILHSSYTYHLWFNISDFNGWLKQLPNLQELKLFIIEPIPKYFYNIHNVIKDCSSLENLIVSGPWFNDKCIKTLIENETNNKNKERHHLKSLTISLNDDVEPHNIKNLICKTNLEKLELNIPQNFDIKKLYNSNMNINFSSLKKNKSTYCFNINDLELIKQSI